MTSISVLINLLRSIRLVLQGLGKFEKISINSKRPKKFTGTFHCFPSLHPRWIYIDLFFFSVIMLIMLEILAQRDKVIPNEFFTWMGLNKKMKLFFLNSDTLSKRSSAISANRRWSLLTTTSSFTLAVSKTGPMMLR